LNDSQQAWYCSIHINHHRAVPPLHQGITPSPPTTSHHSPKLLPSSIGCLTGTTLEGLAEHEQLGLVVDGEHTSTGNTTEDVSTGTLEERLDTLLGDDLATSVDGRLVLDGLKNRG